MPDIPPTILIMIGNLVAIQKIINRGCNPITVGLGKPNPVVNFIWGDFPMIDDQGITIQTQHQIKSMYVPPRIVSKIINMKVFKIQIYIKEDKFVQDEISKEPRVE